MEHISTHCGLVLQEGPSEPVALKVLFEVSRGRRSTTLQVRTEDQFFAFALLTGLNLNGHLV